MELFRACAGLLMVTKINKQLLGLTQSNIRRCADDVTGPESYDDWLRVLYNSILIAGNDNFRIEMVF